MNRSLLLCVSILAAAALSCDSTGLPQHLGSGTAGSTSVGGAGSGSPASAGIGAPGSGGAGTPGTGATDAGSAGAPGTAGQPAPHPCVKGQDAGAALEHRAQAVACPASGMGDQCLMDTDCPNGGVCTCSKFPSQFTNRCVPATCRIDADCGVDGICAPTSSYCGIGQGYRCRSAADTCCTYEDCAGQSANPACGFAPETGHWQCVAPSMCSG
jgi:hypothetical protein